MALLYLEIIPDDVQIIDYRAEKYENLKTPDKGEDTNLFMNARDWIRALGRAHPKIEKAETKEAVIEALEEVANSYHSIAEGNPITKDEFSHTLALRDNAQQLVDFLKSGKTTLHYFSD